MPPLVHDGACHVSAPTLLTPRRALIPVEGFLAQLLPAKDRGVDLHLGMVENATKGGFKYGPTYGNDIGVQLDRTLAEEHVALRLVVNIIVLWNTLYIDAALQQLAREGFSIRPEDVARLSPLMFEHITGLSFRKALSAITNSQTISAKCSLRGTRSLSKRTPDLTSKVRFGDKLNRAPIASN